MSMRSTRRESQGPEILDDEITAAIESMKLRKAEGTGGISAEMIKYIGDKGNKELENCKQIY